MPELCERRLDAAIGVEVSGVDLSEPLPDAVFARLRDAFHRHSVLLIRDQRLDPPALAAFARRFAPLQISANQRYHCPEEPEIMLVGNLRVDGELESMFVNGREDWHIDQIQTARPNVATALYAVETPPEGADRQVLDIVATVVMYHAMAIVTRTFDIPVDEHKPSFSEERHGG